MRSVRSKKLKNETDKYLIGPFDDSLVQIQLDKNQKCIQQINKNNYDRAEEFLRQIKTDGEMISSYNRQKYIIKCLTLNTEAQLYKKQKKWELALGCLEQAESIQKKEQTSPIDIARTKLNKSVILSYMGKHEQSIKQAQIALNLLQHKKGLQAYELRKNQYKLYEIMIASFYSIAEEMSHLSDTNEAQTVYKSGYYLAQKTLGSNHRLTRLLRSIIKSNKSPSKSKSKQKLDVSSLVGSNLISTRKQQTFESQIMPRNNKQKELRKIYASKNNSDCQIHREKYLKNDLSYYLRSIQKLKDGKKRKNHSPNHRMDSFKNITAKIRKLHTEYSDRSRYDSKLGHHQTIKDIILNGKKFSNTHAFSTPNKKHSQERHISQQKDSKQVSIQPLSLPELVKIVEQKPKESKEACQII